MSYITCRSPLAWLLAHKTGLAYRGPFFAVMLAYSVLAVVRAVLFRRGKWKARVA